MPTFSADTLESFARAVFEGAGATPQEAVIVAQNLVLSNLSGHDSHGVIRIPQYCGAIRSGSIRPGAVLEKIQETLTTTVYNANRGFGQVSMFHALTEGLERVRETGLHAFGIRECNHIGRLGHFSDQAARHGAIAFLTVNTTGPGAAVAPFGGCRPKLGTNPISMAFPAEDDPVLVDMTSSIVAEGKIRVRKNKGELLPEGWILDNQGRPSANPDDFYGPPRGAILPFGGDVAHKGFAIGMIADLLAGTLSGAGNVGEHEGPFGNGVFCLLMDVDAFRPVAEYRQAATRFGKYVKDCPPMGAFPEVLLPGEPESRTAAMRREMGIVIDETTWEQVAAEATRCGCTLPTV